MQLINNFLSSTLNTVNYYGAQALSYMPDLKGRVRALSKSLDYYIENISKIFRNTKEREFDSKHISDTKKAIYLDLDSIELRHYNPKYENTNQNKEITEEYVLVENLSRAELIEGPLSPSDSNVSMKEASSSEYSDLDTSSSDEEEEMELFLSPWKDNEMEISSEDDEVEQPIKAKSNQKREMQIQQVFDRNLGMLFNL